MSYIPSSLRVQAEVLQKPSQLSWNNASMHISTH